jgi:RHS repeat-associated protein
LSSQGISVPAPGPLIIRGASVSPEVGRQGYAGGYTDPDGLIYLQSRYYDPATGQFISVDPQVSQTDDPYGYADGDPVAETDPTGEASGFVWSYHSWGKFCYPQYKGYQYCPPAGFLLGAAYGLHGKHGETLIQVAGAWTVNARIHVTTKTLCFPTLRFVFRPRGRRAVRIYSEQDATCEGQNRNYTTWEPDNPLIPNSSITPNASDGAAWYCYNGRVNRSNTLSPCIDSAHWFWYRTPLDVELWAEDKRYGRRYRIASTGVVLTESGGNEGPS